MQVNCCQQAIVRMHLRGRDAPFSTWVSTTEPPFVIWLRAITFANSVQYGFHASVNVVELVRG